MPDSSSPKIDIGLVVSAKIAGESLILEAQASKKGTAKQFDFSGEIDFRQNGKGLSITEFLSRFQKQNKDGPAVIPENIIPSADLNYLRASYTTNKKRDNNESQSGNALRFVCDGDISIDKEPIEFEIFFTSESPVPLSSGTKSVASKRSIALGVNLIPNLSFSKLPVVGDTPALKEASLNALGFVYATESGTYQTPKLIKGKSLDNKKPTDFAQPSTQSSVAIENPGFNIICSVTLPGKPPTPTDSGPSAGIWTLPLTGRSDSPATTSTNKSIAKSPIASDAPSATSSGMTKWFSVQKSLGPVSFQRIGITFQDSKLTLMLDASLSLGGLNLTMDGLGVGSPLTKFEPSFHLNGLGLTLKTGPLELSGSLMSVPSPPTGVDFQYDGEAVIKFASFSISALGSYAIVGKSPSLFVFAFLDMELGGPPYFYVTGLCAGFGYNRSFRVPGQNEIASCPLVAGLTDPAALGGKGAAPSQALQLLEKSGFVPVDIGQNWLAAGIQFSTFELVQSHAVVVVEFGCEFELMILGLSTLSLPQNSAFQDAYIYVQLQIEVALLPSEGEFLASAVLSSNSFLLDPNCHLTGGFAFYLWFGGEHEGDFVITLGGYNPAFLPHPWYPKEPRLGFNWLLSDVLVIKGGAYFALTPSAIMAGGGLSIIFHTGGLRAWFIAQADFLIQWKPFHYDIYVGVSIGVSVTFDLFGATITLGFELGASIDLWGPPFGGYVEIHLWIISFSIPIGAAKLPPPPIGWPEFQQLIAAQQQKKSKGTDTASASNQSADSNSLASVVINDGLVAKIKSEGQADQWVVRAELFAFTVESAIPISTLSATSTPIRNNTDIAVRPMQLTGLDSKFSIRIIYPDQTSQDLIDWNSDPLTRGIPEALWGQPIKPDSTPAIAAKLIDGCLLGLSQITPKNPVLTGTEPIDFADYYDTIDRPDQSDLPLSTSALEDPGPVSLLDAA